MDGILTFFTFIAIIVVLFLIWSNYDSKLNKVLNFFKDKTKQFNFLADAKFEEKTNGKKISRWDNQHIIDYIININHIKIINELKNYNELKI